MLRVVLIQILLFLAPFIGFAFYLYFTKGNFRDGSEWTPRMAWLAVAGFVCTMAGFFALVVFEEGSRDAVYRPAQNVDGQIIPGRLEQPETAPEQD
jgi:hypothetical protein